MCFSIGWLIQLAVFLIVLFGVLALLRLWVYPMMAANVDSRVPQTINIILWVVVAIVVLYFLADLLMCAFGSGGFGYRPILR